MGPAVDIDVSGALTKAELHELLYRKLGFPDYYGRNWDAFDECISDSDLPLPKSVTVRGMRALAAILPREAALFRKCGSQLDAIPKFDWHD